MLLVLYVWPFPHHVCTICCILFETIHYKTPSAHQDPNADPAPTPPDPLPTNQTPLPLPLPPTLHFFVFSFCTPYTYTKLPLPIHTLSLLSLFSTLFVYFITLLSLIWNYPCTSTCMYRSGQNQWWYLIWQPYDWDHVISLPFDLSTLVHSLVLDVF